MSGRWAWLPIHIRYSALPPRVPNGWKAPGLFHFPYDSSLLCSAPWVFSLKYGIYNLFKSGRKDFSAFGGNRIILLRPDNHISAFVIVKIAAGRFRHARNRHGLVILEQSPGPVHFFRMRPAAGEHAVQPIPVGFYHLLDVGDYRVGCPLQFL